MQTTPDTAYLRLVRTTQDGAGASHVATIRRDLLARYGAAYLDHLTADGADVYLVEPDADPAAPAYLCATPAAVAAAAELRAAGVAVHRSGLPVPLDARADARGGGR